MDCLVQDFPFSTVHLFEDSLNNASKQNATNQEDSVTFDKSIIDENPTVQDALPEEAVTSVCAKTTSIIQIGS